MTKFITCLYLLLWASFLEARQERITKVPFDQNGLTNLVEKISWKNFPNRTPPKVMLINDERSLELLFVARPDPVIRVGKGILSFCEQYEEKATDALVFLLSHELAHFFGDHESKYERIDRSILEQEADYSGLKMTFYAGYASLGIASEVLQDFYDLLLVEPSNDYPLLSARLGIIEQTIKSLEKDIFVYEAAAFLQYAGHYQEANELFERIAPFLSIPEVKNNLAGSYLNMALQNMPEGEMFYAYPIEVNPGLRLERRLQRGTGVEADKFDSQLSKAETLLNKLLILNPNYPPALLNLSITQFLKGKTDQAEETLEKYRAAGSELPNYYLMKAFIADARGEGNKAARSFSRAVQNSDYEARFNRRIFKLTEKTIKRKLPTIIRKSFELPSYVKESHVWANPLPEKFDRLTTLNQDKIVKVDFGVDKELVLKLNLDGQLKYLLYPSFLCTTCDLDAINARRTEIENYVNSLSSEHIREINLSTISIRDVVPDNLLLFMNEGELIGWFRYVIN